MIGCAGLGAISVKKIMVRIRIFSITFGETPVVIYML